VGDLIPSRRASYQPSPISGLCCLPHVKQLASASMRSNACSVPRNISIQLRKAAQKFLFLHPDVAFVKDLTNSVLSLLSCFSFVWGTYLAEDSSESAASYVVALDLFELGASSFFALDYILQIILAPNKLSYALSAAALTDFVTTFPQLLLYIIPFLNLSSSEIEYSAKFNFLRFVRVLKVMRLERIGREKAIMHPKVFAETLVSSTVSKLVLTIITIVFIFSGVFGVVESTFGDPVRLANSKQGKLDFFNCVYFVLTTMSTVGFGDIVPVSAAGQLVYVILMFVTLVVVARQLDQLTSMLKSQSKYSRDSYNNRHRHVIVCGDVDFESLKVFLEEFMHKDHNTSNIRVVVLVNEDPDWDMQMLLDNSAFSNVKYLRGSPLEQNDLLRCKILKASCVFILNDPGSKNVIDSDNRCILRALSVGAAAHNPESDQLLVCQLHSMLSKRRFLSIISPKLNAHIICWEELRPSILSACCENPCFGVFLCNWIKSFSYSESPFLTLRSLGWQQEYIHGKNLEIYAASICGFGHSTFHAVAAFLHMKFCVTLIAIATSNKEIILAPQGFVFEASPTSVYLLAESESHVKKLQDFDPIVSAHWKSFEKNFLNADDGKSANEPHNDDDIGSKKSKILLGFQSVVKKSKMTASVVKGFANTLIKKSDPEPVHQPVVAPKNISRNWSILRRAVSVGAALKAGLRFSSTMSREQYAFLLESELNPKFNRLQSQLYFHVCEEISSAKVDLGFCGRFEGHGHIVYCCRQAVGMRRFIAPLRSKHRTRMTPVVILCNTISEREFANISIFPSVFVVVGNALASLNLVRASIATARVAVICMSQKSNSSANESSESDVTIDSSVIFLYNLIKSLNPDCAIVSEMRLLENSKYLEDKPNLKGSRDFGELFAAGTIFPQAFFTTLTCQCFFNPVLPTLIIELLRPSPISNLSSRVHPSVLVTFLAPSNIWGQSVSQVFQMLCRKGIVLLGIIRAPSKRLGNSLPFAYACPNAFSFISQGDAFQTLSCQGEDMILKQLNDPILCATSSLSKDSAVSEPLLSHDSEKLLVELVSKLAVEVTEIRRVIRR
jgi:hypothetical protein